MIIALQCGPQDRAGVFSQPLPWQFEKGMVSSLYKQAVFASQGILWRPREKTGVGANHRACDLPPFASAADARAYFYRETERLANGDIDLALARFDEAIRLDPGNAQTHLRRGVARLELGKREPALADFAEAIRLAPGLYEAYLWHGSHFLGRGIRSRVRGFRRGLPTEPLRRGSAVLARQGVFP